MSQVVDTRLWELPKSAASRFSRLALSTTSFCCKHYIQLTSQQQEDRVKCFFEDLLWLDIYERDPLWCKADQDAA